MQNDPTTRFSDRVADYVKYRPSYPQAVIDHLVAHCQLTPQSVVADMGSGTGIFSKLLLEYGCTVYGVEPNAAMRQAADALLRDFPKFHSVAATAEATTLPDASVDFITAAQAFHWFDLPRFKQECQRIGKSGGQLVVLWNDRETDTTPFLSGYENFLRKHALDYRKVDHKRFGIEQMEEFFAPAQCHYMLFANHQDRDRDALLGRVLSSSYMPGRDDPGFEALVKDLDILFEMHEKNGLVRLDYRTQIYFGEIV